MKTLGTVEAALSITLSKEEIVRITQSRNARIQVDELRTRGFWRARLGIKGGVILERAHYEAVCAGALDPGVAASNAKRPQLRPIQMVSKSPRKKE